APVSASARRPFALQCSSALAISPAAGGRVCRNVSTVALQSDEGISGYARHGFTPLREALGVIVACTPSVHPVLDWREPQPKPRGRGVARHSVALTPSPADRGAAGGGMGIGRTLRIFTGSSIIWPLSTPSPFVADSGAS